MRVAECINGIYEAGIRNDQICLLYLSNKNAQIVVKIASGNTNQMTIKDKVMQGRVWGGLM